MPTQGGIVNWKIDKFYVEEPASAEPPADIIALNSSFDLKVDFSGSGGAWQGYVNASANYVVNFYAEGIGVGVPEIDFGEIHGRLVAGTNTVKLPVPNGIDKEGVYRLGCLIKISPPSGINGYEENLLISVAQGA